MDEFVSSAHEKTNTRLPTHRHPTLPTPPGQTHGRAGAPPVVSLTTYDQPEKAPAFGHIRKEGIPVPARN